MYRNLATYVKRNQLTGERQTYVWESTWDKDGNRIELETAVDPYFYVEDLCKGDKISIEDKINKEESSSDIKINNVMEPLCAKSMYKTPLTKFTFKTDYERRIATSRIYETPLYESLTPTRQYLLDKYVGQETSTEFSKNKFRIFFIDLEVKIENEFPRADQAKYPINVISLFDSLTSKMHIWTCHTNVYDLLNDKNIEKIKNDVKEYASNIEICIYKFAKEKHMLEDFMDFWTNNYPDIVTGWNIDGFDMPYLIGRLNNIDSKGKELSIYLSPLNGYIKNPIKSSKNAKDGIISYTIAGITILDYMRIYKKFDPSSKQSFKLDFIGKLELGIGKLDYNELGFDTIKDFMTKDFVTFVLYNIIDVIIVKLLDDTLHYITLARLICNVGLCEYDNILKSIPYILGAITIQARENNVKFLTDANHKPKPIDPAIKNMTLGELRTYEAKRKRELKKAKKENSFEGAFVVPTIAGYYNNGIFAFDFNSLYPNIIMTINISPETKVGKILCGKDVDVLSLPTMEFITRQGKKKELTHDILINLLTNHCTMSSNNVLYIKPSIEFGLIPQFLDRMYKERVRIKNLMKQTKRNIEKIDDAISKLEKML